MGALYVLCPAAPSSFDGLESLHVRGGRPGETGYERAFIALNVQFWGYGEGSSLTAVFLSAENMAAQREWTPMVSSR